LEVNVLSLRNQKRRIERRKAQRNNELVIHDCTTDVTCNLDLVADALLGYGTRICYQQHLARPLTQRLFELSLPIVTTAKSQNVSPNFVAED
jgi:hypothetical protein